MNTKLLSPRALSVIDQYLHFKFGAAVCSVPYFNNKTVRARAALRVAIGKGSPQDIYEEIQAVAVKQHVISEALSDEALKKLLVEYNFGIDCSAFAFYVLNAENQELGKGPLERHLSFVNCTGIVGKIRCALRPVENCDVATLAHDKNSIAVEARDIQPGDMITMLGDSEENEPSSASLRRGERDHILIVHQIEYQNFVPYKIHYSHAVAYPEDGIQGTGIKQGEIDILDPAKPLLEARWHESGREGIENHIFSRAKKSKTELRRLKWWS